MTLGCQTSSAEKRSADDMWIVSSETAGQHLITKEDVGVMDYAARFYCTSLTSRNQAI